MYYLTLDEIKQLRHFDVAADAAGAKNPQVGARSLLVPLCCDVRADMETPVSVYCKTAQGPFSFLLESVANGERIARYSFIGIDPYMVMTQHGETAKLYKSSCERKSTDTRSSLGHPCSTPYTEEGSFIIEEVSCHDPLELVEAEMSQYRLVKPAGIIDELPHFHGGAVGYLAYESVARFEHLPVPSNDELGLPLAIFCFTETVLVFDHLKHRVRIVTHLHLDAPDLDAEYQRGLTIIDEVRKRLRQALHVPEEPIPISDAAALKIVSNRTRCDFEAMVRQAQEYIRAGDIFQVVLSQRLSRHVNAAPFTVYRALRTINPSPYLFYLDMHDFHIIGASPELLVRVEGGDVTIHPIAGTRPRGTNRQSDRELADELKNDAKERAEHVMLAPIHGKTSLVFHQGQGILRDLPMPFEANRYHSLIVERSSLPAELEITAETADGLIMGLRHRTYPIEGMQFHPESIMTPVGRDLLRNFLTNKGEAQLVATLQRERHS